MANSPYWFKSGAPAVVSVIGNDLSAPIVLTLLPAGHKPGIYNTGFCVINRTAPLTGTLARTYGYSAPTFGPTTAAGGGISITQSGAAGATSFTTFPIVSDGTAPITLTLTPATITGSPITDIYGYAELAAAL